MVGTDHLPFVPSYVDWFACESIVLLHDREENIARQERRELLGTRSRLIAFRGCRYLRISRESFQPDTQINVVWLTWKSADTHASSPRCTSDLPLSSYSDRESVMLPWRSLINPDKYIRIIYFIVSYAYCPYNYVTLSNRSFEMTRIACLMGRSIGKAGYEDCVELFKCTRDKNATQRRTQRYLTSSRVGTRYMEQSRHSSKNSY